MYVATSDYEDGYGNFAILRTERATVSWIPDVLLNNAKHILARLAVSYPGDPFSSFSPVSRVQTIRLLHHRR